MTTAAKRARKKANKPDPKIDSAVQEQADIAEQEMTAVTTESEHAAAMQALAKAKRMRQRKAEG